MVDFKAIDAAVDLALKTRNQDSGQSTEPVAAPVDYRALVSGAVEVRTEAAEVPLPEPESRLSSFEFGVARKSRAGPARSYKLTNVEREISRTVYFSFLLALVGPAIAVASPVVGPIALIAAVAYAGFKAVSATLGYSEACVLHKAWKLAQSKGTNRVKLADIHAVRAEIATEYDAPKCQSEAEIEDAIRNLIGLKAMSREGDELILKEKIVFFADGNIMN